MPAGVVDRRASGAGHAGTIARTESFVRVLTPLYFGAYSKSHREAATKGDTMNATTVTQRFIGRCTAGHSVIGTASDFIGGGTMACPCGRRACVKAMTVRITDHKCGVKCTSALGPVCDCSCGGERHGEDHRS